MEVLICISLSLVSSKKSPLTPEWALGAGGGGPRGPEAFFSLPAGGTEADGGGAVFGLVARVRAAGAGLGGRAARRRLAPCPVPGRPGGV